MKKTILDLQCRSTKDNLIFFGLPEAKLGHIENCQDTISKFMKNELKIIKDIHLGNAHRFGSNERGPRPIVARFLFHNDLEFVLRSRSL